MSFEDIHIKSHQHLCPIEGGRIWYWIKNVASRNVKTNKGASKLHWTTHSNKSWNRLFDYNRFFSSCTYLFLLKEKKKFNSIEVE
jgi:hypothetical protein